MKNFIDLKCDYNLYKNFYAVIKLGGFSAAAKELYISQPAISYSIKKLETILGVKLIYRNSKSIFPTLEGKKLYQFIDKAHNILICGEKSMNDSSALVEGEISIGVPTHIANFLLLKSLKNFNSKYPNIKINVFSRSTREMVNMLNDNTLDLIIDSYPFNDIKDGIVVKHLTEVKTCLAYSPDYFNEKESIISKVFILPNQYTETRKTINAYLEQNDLQLGKVIEASTTELTLSLTLAKMGIGYFFEPSIIKELECGLLKKLKLIHQLPSITIGYAYNNYYVNYATQTFINMLENNYDKT